MRARLGNWIKLIVHASAERRGAARRRATPRAGMAGSNPEEASRSAARSRLFRRG
jgi:hypothetical protein